MNKSNPLITLIRDCAKAFADSFMLALSLQIKGTKAVYKAMPVFAVIMTILSIALIAASIYVWQVYGIWWAVGLYCVVGTVLNLISIRRGITAMRGGLLFFN